MIRRSPLTRSRKTTRQLLILENDELFRQLIRARDKVCQKTQRPTNLQVSHYWSREILRTRWDLDNACLLNAHEHIYWAHVHHKQFEIFWLRRLGKERFYALELRARYVAPMKTEYLIWINLDLKKQLSSLPSTEAV